MRKFLTDVWTTERKSVYPSVAMWLILLWIAQTIVTTILLRFLPLQSQSVWTLMDRMSPVSHFVSSLTLPFVMIHGGVMPILGSLIIVAVEFAVWSLFTFLALRTIIKYESPNGKYSLSHHLQLSAILLPVFIAASLAGHVVMIATQNFIHPGFWQNILAGFVPDFVTMLILAIFMPAYLFWSAKRNVIKSLRSSILAFVGRIWVFIGLAAAIALVINILSVVSMNTTMVSNGLYIPLRMSLQALGWLAGSCILIFTGFAYHCYKIKHPETEALASTKE